MVLENIRDKLLEAEGAYNVRELGGYCGSLGRVIQRNRFLRADSLSYLTERGMQALLDWGVDCVVDLRSTTEASNLPDMLEAHPAVDYYHVPMLDYIQSSLSGGEVEMFPESMDVMYKGLLDKGMGQFLEVFRIFSDERYACTLFHCTAGKDRTGVTAMLLLGLAGVEEATIVEDYAYSQYLAAPRFQEAAKTSRLPRHVFESHPNTMRATLSHLNSKYGGAAEYLQTIGLGEWQQERILRKLFDA